MNMNKVDTYKEEAEKAKIEWLEAEKRLDHADDDLKDSVIYDIMSKRSRYMAFVRRLKNEVFN